MFKCIFFFYCEYTYEYSYINFCEKEFCVKSDEVKHHGTKNKSGLIILVKKGQRK